MRYFIAKDAGAIVREKHVFAGDDSKADALVAQYLASHPGFTALEVDQPTFDATPCTPDQTPARNSALDALVNGQSPDVKLMRSILLVILDEINLIRTNAALNLAARTKNQMVTAIQNKINSGAAD